jgi:hypothetical protein
MGIKKALLKDTASAREEGRSSVCSVAHLVWRSGHWRRQSPDFDQRRRVLPQFHPQQV